MMYKNTKTGRVITVKSVISGGNWRAVQPANFCISKVRKTTRKKGKDGTFCNP